MQMFSLLILSKIWDCNYSDVTSEAQVGPIKIHTWILIVWLPKFIQCLEAEGTKIVHVTNLGHPLWEAFTHHSNYLGLPSYPSQQLVYFLYDTYMICTYVFVICSLAFSTTRLLLKSRTMTIFSTSIILLPNGYLDCSRNSRNRCWVNGQMTGWFCFGMNLIDSTALD